MEEQISIGQVKRDISHLVNELPIEANASSLLRGVSPKQLW